MTIAFRGFVTGENNDNPSNTIIVVDPGNAGDCLLAFWQCDGGAQTVNPPDGSWTTLFSPITTGTDGATMWGYVKTSSAGGGGNLTFTSTQTLRQGLVVVAYSGVDSTTPLQATPVTETHDDGRASPANIIAPTITTTADGCQLVWVGYGDTTVNTPATVGFTPPGGYSSRVAFSDTVGWEMICVADKAQGTQGASGAATGVMSRTSATFGVVGLHIALAPGAGGGGSDTGLAWITA